MVKEDHSRKGYFSAQGVYPQFAPHSAFHALVNAYVRDTTRKGLRQFLTESRGMEKPTHPYAYEVTSTVALAHPSLISVRQMIYSYTGGAHPNTFWPAMTFGMVHGKPKRLSLDDVLKDGASPTWVDDLVLTRLRRKEASWVVDGAVTSLTDDQRANFTVDAKGMTWWFAPYEMGPYVQGMFEIHIGWPALRPYLNPTGPLRHLLAARG